MTDVLSSIRKLVSQDATRRSEEADERLVLSPDFRVKDRLPPFVATAEHAVPPVEEAGFIAVEDDEPSEVSATVQDLHGYRGHSPEPDTEEDEILALDGGAEAAMLAALSTDDLTPDQIGGLSGVPLDLRTLLSQALTEELNRAPDGPLATAVRQMIRQEIARMVSEEQER